MTTTAMTITATLKCLVLPLIWSWLQLLVRVENTSELFIDEDFMMNIFFDFQTKVDTFADSLNYMSMKKSSKPIGGSRKQVDTAVSYDGVIAEICYPVQR